MRNFIIIKKIKLKIQKANGLCERCWKEKRKFVEGKIVHHKIEITDQNLIEKTGGIVQGMSGSPIVQNGKLVGAVTHVFVNQVERGYAVFATNMLDTIDNVAAKHENAA